MSSTDITNILADPSKRHDGLVIDALAYADEDLLSNPSMRSYVDKLILDEMRVMEKSDYLSGSALLPLDDPRLNSASELIKYEMDRIKNGGKFEVENIDHSIPALPQSLSVPSISEAIQRAQVAVEAENLRGINIELLNQYGINNWKSLVVHMNKLAELDETEKASIEEEIDLVNVSRKAAQVPYANKIRNMSNNYLETVNLNFKTELACIDLEQQIKRSRHN